VNTFCRFGLFFLAVLIPMSALTQEQPAQQQATKIVSVSAKTTTARIAAPDELVTVNGKVMKVADVVAVLSSSTLLEQRLRIPEKQNSSDVPQNPPQSKIN
jgi:hypothetical protein